MSYQGATIHPTTLLGKIVETAHKAGFTTKILAEVQSFPIYWLEKPATAKSSIRVYLSTGVHGDEPAGPLALLKLLETEYFTKNHTIHWLISPMLNPSGFALNTRENHQGIDLNRDFKYPNSMEVNCLIDQLKKSGKFDLALMVHEDWETNGFYLYDLASNPSPNPARKILQQVAACSPIEQADEIEGMPAESGIITADANTALQEPEFSESWPEAFYLHQHHQAVYQYTLESASALKMETRVQSLITAISTAVNSIIDGN